MLITCSYVCCVCVTLFYVFYGVCLRCFKFVVRVTCFLQFYVRLRCFTFLCFVFTLCLSWFTFALRVLRVVAFPGTVQSHFAVESTYLCVFLRPVFCENSCFCVCLMPENREKPCGLPGPNGKHCRDIFIHTYCISTGYPRGWPLG